MSLEDRNVCETRADGFHAKRRGLHGCIAVVLTGMLEGNCMGHYLQHLLGMGQLLCSLGKSIAIYFRIPTEPNFLSSFFKCILNLPRAVMSVSRFNSQRALSVRALCASF